MRTGAVRTSTEPLVLSEVGTLHLEFTYLSALTGDARFQTAIDRVADFLANDFYSEHGSTERSTACRGAHHAPCAQTSMHTACIPMRAICHVCIGMNKIYNPRPQQLHPLLPILLDPATGAPLQVRISHPPSHVPAFPLSHDWLTDPNMGAPTCSLTLLSALVATPTTSTF